MSVHNIMQGQKNIPVRLCINEKSCFQLIGWIEQKNMWLIDINPPYQLYCLIDNNTMNNELTKRKQTKEN